MAIKEIEYIPFIPKESMGLLTSDGKLFRVKDEVTYNYDFYLYKSVAEVNRVDKRDFLRGVKNVSGVFREECSITSPTVLLEIDPTLDFNYIHVPAFGRWYFVTDKKIVNNKLCSVELACDVLMSFKDSIENLECVIARQEHLYNDLLVDDQAPTNNKTVSTIVNIPSTTFFTDQSYPFPHCFLLSVISDTTIYDT